MTKTPRSTSSRSLWIAGVVAGCAIVLAGCPNTNTGPGAGIKWTSYPSLASSTRSYPWLVVKCQLSDVAAIPAGLDLNIQRFFGISGAGYGNMVDYFHDVSYNHASVISDTFIGWNKSTISTADLTYPTGRLSTAAKRGQRVQECLQSIPAAQLPDLSAFYGVVVVNNAVQDGGACYTGQSTLTVAGKGFNLACVWFDPNSLLTEFAMHEIGHGLGLDHSYDDSGRNCNGQPGEYCDPFDIMSAQGTYQFADPNWLIAGNPSTAGPGLDAPGLLKMGWLPSANQRRFDYEGANEQTFTLKALSHPTRTDPMVVLLDVGSTTPFEGIYTVEYRQGDGWDRGFVTAGNAPAAVSASGGTVLVHQYRPAGAPTSTLINGSFSGALQPCNTLVLTGLSGLAFHVTAKSFDLTNGTAVVAVGFGRGAPTHCFLDPHRVIRTLSTRDHVHVAPDTTLRVDVPPKVLPHHP